MLDILRTAYDWLNPHICVGCGLTSGSKLDLCDYCHAFLPWLKERCYQCGTTMHGLDESIICAKCQSSPPPYQRLCALFAYQQPIIRLINSLKFGRQLYPAKLFSKLLFESIINGWYLERPLPELIIPVPLHIKRHKQRGYNQAIEIGFPLAKALDISFDFNACQRIRFTQAQARLPRIKRLQNLNNAFKANRAIFPEHIAIVDDVVTTGSTMRALSLLLQAHGVQQVDIWCVCR